uniref:Uncharacterized protein n=1 Tax=Moniliophthora roreri TaxID=221103 RepID=A0A0W0G3B5_MONRR
MSASLLPHEH